LADLLSVSRFPVGQALRLLASKGVVTHERNRGYFVSGTAAASPEALGLPTGDDSSDAYFRIAEDHLNGRLPDPASEAFLRERYRLTKGAAQRRAGPDRPGGLGGASHGVRLVVLAHAHHPGKP
jgi:hypothetical protein